MNSLSVQSYVVCRINTSVWEDLIYIPPNHVVTSCGWAKHCWTLWMTKCKSCDRTPMTFQQHWLQWHHASKINWIKFLKKLLKNCLNLSTCLLPCLCATTVLVPITLLLQFLFNRSISLEFLQVRPVPQKWTFGKLLEQDFLQVECPSCYGWPAWWINSFLAARQLYLLI